MRTKLLLLLLLSLTITACGGGKNQSVIPENVPSKKPTVENQLKLKSLWSTTVGGDFNDDAAGFKIEADSTAIYTASQNGLVRAIDRQKGKIIWKRKFKNGLSAGVGLGQQQVFVANQKGEVIALSTEDGTELWRYQASSEVLTAPAASDDIIIVRSSDGKVHGLSANDGRSEWILQRDLPRLSLRGDSQPLLTQGVAVIGFATGNMLAIRAKDGAVIWDVPVSTPRGSNEIERIIDIYSKPLLIRQTLIANTFQGSVIAIDVPTRKLLWRAQHSSYQDISTDNVSLYVSNEEGQLLALDSQTGDTVWSKDDLLYRNISSPSLLGSYLLVFGNDKDMYLFAKEDGALFGRYKFASGSMIGKPLIDGNQFYVLTSNGSLRAYELTQ